jgi:hypothetical protein
VREACDLASYLLTRVRESDLLNKQIEEKT